MEEKKAKLTPLSIIALCVSLAAAGLFFLTVANVLFRPLWVLVTVASVIMPAVAKKKRIDHEGKGKGLEIAALIIGGFLFYMVVFLATDLSVFFGYLGYIIGGLVYRAVQ